MITRCFHYTTEAGLDGILRTQELWGTSIDYMDDPREVQLSWQISSDIAGHWSGRSRAFDRVVRQIAHWAGKGQEAERFVISFCSQPDYLLAWRAYAADSYGYCLEFTPAGLKTGDGWYLARVEYDEAEHRTEVQRLLTRLERAYMSVEKTIHQQFLTQQLATTTAMWMSLIAPTFKDATYESEREWRLIHMRFTDKTQQPPTTVAHRLRGGEDVSYMPRPVGGNAPPSLNLTRILCGARVSDRAVAAVSRLASARFPGCDVARSRIEFRRR